MCVCVLGVRFRVAVHRLIREAPISLHSNSLELLIKGRTIWTRRQDSVWLKESTNRTRQSPDYNQNITPVSWLLDLSDTEHK